ncbi:Neutral/alkaline nonlysosomal ceramidase [Microthyrium microscopicum]|uniref:Neutral ceramidase n=1 Tax=Microthyrium microscopicum TaxID=703497 RepID=A0A6A6UUE6_9PEZI|nr:Neutral/alkaline nonlysosomal ceramidase [Microthyrium microscopicum]
MLAPAAPDGHHYLLGVGKGDITGPVVDLIFMGYADANQIGSGVRQRLYSRAFIIGDLKKPEDRIVYLVLDIQSGDIAVRDGVLKGLQQLGPEYSMYTKDNIALTGTHSHSGPGAWTNYFLHHASTRGFDRPSWEAIVNGTVLSIKRAHEKLKEGRISWGKIRLEDANFNRSPSSYRANPESERTQYTDNVDKEMTMLRFADLDHKDYGVLTFFPTHGTSMYLNQTMVTGDNKGVAAYLFERKMQAKFPGFIAGFSQSNVGDVTPNVLGDYCESGPDLGKRCNETDTTCGGIVAPCHSRGPFFGLNDGGRKSCFEIGKRQFEKAYELHQIMSVRGPNATEIPVRGPVKAFHTFQNMSWQEFPHPNGSTVMTCPSAMGYSFAAGTSDGPGIADFRQGLTGDQPPVSPIWPILRGLLKNPTPRQKECHGVKPILLDIGEMTTPYEWGPNIADIQLMRVGPIILIISTGEATTMSGRRWKSAISKAVLDQGIFKDHPRTANETPVVVLGGPANSYTHYITTEEEYAKQRYEGASTLYGPHTLNAMIHYSIQGLRYLSATNEVKPPAGPQPPINVDRAMSLIPSVSSDSTPWGKNYGDVLNPPNATYNRGDTINVTFVGASPRNNLRLEGTFAAVQKLNAEKAIKREQAVLPDPERSAFSTNEITLDQSDAEWTTVRDDFDWELVMEWKKVGTVFKHSESTISWETAADTEPGTYRFVYNGDWRAISGAITPFQGISPSFTVS